MDAVTNVNNTTLASQDGARLVAAATRDGSMFTAGWYDRMALAGRVYQATGGTVTTPITFGAGTIDTTEPDFDMSVPAGTLVIPLEIDIYMEAFGTSAQFECMASVGVGGVVGATTTQQTPTCLRMDNPNGASACTVWTSVDASGATYMTSNVSEFWRDGLQFAITKTAGSATVAAADPFKFSWRRNLSAVGPILYHPTSISRLNVFAASQAGTGFITVKWIELPTSAIV